MGQRSAPRGITNIARRPSTVVAECRWLWPRRMYRQPG
jgi:hypothetical protein